MADKYKAGDIIKKVDDTPFPDEGTAARQAGLWAKRGVETDVIEVEGGWALKVAGADSGKRPKRTPLGYRNVLSAPEVEKGYVRRFVNDTEDRIKRFEDAGWEVVTHPGKAGDNYVGNTRLPGGAVTKPGGHGVTMVLMKKRKDWFDEDYADKMKDVDRREQGLIKKAQLDNLHAAPDTEGIRIDRPGR